ncbi:MAG: reprolysin-like metallopeptidase, partial [Verrucomicrobiota bacterium]
MDMSPNGFHAQVLSPNGNWYIDPWWKNDTSFYSCYTKKDLAGKHFSCSFDGSKIDPRIREARKARPSATDLTTGSTRRTYRLSVTGQGEYTVFFGGVAAAMNGIVTTMNRVNGIYERDMAVRMQLVANNNLIVYPNPATDPFSANDSSGTTLSENQSNTDAVIGNGNYDIGHIFNTGGGGLAGLGVVCFNSQKAEGATGSNFPMGDPFDVDFVSHELGHQFGADHTFNGTQGSCGGNRNASTAYEKGSGTTIMSYAGICGSDNVQPNANDYFHAGSLEQMNAYLNSESCEVSNATGNTPPSVNAGANYTIPRNTPFTLTATGTDANGDTLTYCWEQMDLGAAQVLTAADNGQSPLFRSRPPTTDPSRTFPELADILSNTSDNDEVLPTLARTMTMRVTARDNRANGGGTDSDETSITVNNGSGPFVVTFPNTAVSISGMQNVTWNPANTQNAPVSTPNVNILLSTDGGLTFPTTLAANTPNDGSQMVTLPVINTTTARIKIEGAGNIFFDISNVNFTITPGAGVPVFDDGGSHTVNDSTGNGNNNSVLDPGENGIQLFLNVLNSSGASATGVNGTLTSLSPTVTIGASASSYPNLGGGATDDNNTPYTINIDPSHPCGAPVLLRLSMTSNEGSNTVDINLSTGMPQAPQTLLFNAGIPIPDNNTININVPVGISGTISDLDFRFDGSACSTVPTDTNNGLNHSWVGDLVITLISPTGTQVRIMDRPGAGAFGSGGFNFCQTLFNDDGAFPAIDSIVQTDEPHTGTWLPEDALSAFDGEEANGTWTLRITDSVTDDTGQLNNFSMIFTLSGCTPPSMNPTYTITASAGPNGTIAPSGAVVVNSGDSANFLATADTYYHLLEILVNGSPIGMTFGPGFSSFNYMWNNVMADGTIQANFSENLATIPGCCWWR